MYRSECSRTQGFHQTILAISCCSSQMGYGRKAMEILQNYFEGKIPNLDENGTESEVKTVQPEVRKALLLICIEMTYIVKHSAQVHHVQLY